MKQRNIIVIGCNQKAADNSLPTFAFMTTTDASGEVQEYSLPEITCNPDELPAALGRMLGFTISDHDPRLTLCVRYQESEDCYLNYYHLNVSSSLGINICNVGQARFDRLMLLNLPNDFYSKISRMQDSGIEYFVEYMRDIWFKRNYVRSPG